MVSRGHFPEETLTITLPK